MWSIFSVLFNMIFAAFATAFELIFFLVGVSSGMAYCEELEAPAALDKGKCVLPGES